MRGKKKKKTEVAINCQGGAVAFMFLSSPLPLCCAASPAFLTLSHELGLVAFVRIRQMAPPGQ